MIPLKNADITLSDRMPKYIILHHTHELVPDLGLDTENFQLNTFRRKNYMMHKEQKWGYHIVIDRIKDDYYPIVSQPLFTVSEWPDMDPIYWKALHVAFIGNYDNDMLMDRAYKVLAFQVLVPYCRFFRLTFDRVLLHRDVSNDKTNNCPGEFFDLVRLNEYFRIYYKHGPTINRT